MERKLENVTIRLETPQDYREVENLTREAFWNKYRPGCMEHYVLHCYRSRPEFVKELDYVVEEVGKIVAHIMYSHAQITGDNGRTVPILIFGPVSVLPEEQGKGVGSLIVNRLEADDYFRRAWRTEVGSSLTAVRFYRKMGGKMQ